MADEDKKPEGEEEKAPKATTEEKAPKTPAEKAPEAAPEAEASKEDAPAEAEAPAETAEPAAEATPETPAEEPEVEELPHSNIRPGMTVRVHERIRDVSPKGEARERVQVFEGMVLKQKGAQNQKTITVRKITKGFGVEKIFPLSSPNITKIEVVKEARVRRANLSYLRKFKRKLREVKKMQK